MQAYVRRTKKSSSLWILTKLCCEFAWRWMNVLNLINCSASSWSSSSELSHTFSSSTSMISSNDRKGTSAGLFRPDIQKQHGTIQHHISLHKILNQFVDSCLFPETTEMYVSLSIPWEECAVSSSLSSSLLPFFLVFRILISLALPPPPPFTLPVPSEG